jgi:DNA-binding transcriptional ArsR family regulator
MYELKDSNKALNIIRALNHELRFKMIMLISDRGRCCPSEIEEESGLVQSEVSRHLATLRNANIILPEKEGKYIYYSLNNNLVSRVFDFIEGLGKVY